VTAHTVADAWAHGYAFGVALTFQHVALGLLVGALATIIFELAGRMTPTIASHVRAFAFTYAALCTLAGTGVYLYAISLP
jgi:hypothetical protein